jgi:hypothetical protein
MPSIAIALVVVIAAIGQLQLQFVNAALPYAGSLCKCCGVSCICENLPLCHSQTIVGKPTPPLTRPAPHGPMSSNAKTVTSASPELAWLELIKKIFN